MYKKRIDNDFYETHEKGLVQAMLNEWDYRYIDNPVILEPCNGMGAISGVLRWHSFAVITNDLNFRDSDFSLDATILESWGKFPDIDWVITNPPYSQASEIVRLAHEKATYGVIALLRLSFLEPCANRASWLRENPPYKIVILNTRPRFRTDTKGSDSVTSGWFFWDKISFDRDTKLIFCNDWKDGQTHTITD